MLPFFERLWPIALVLVPLALGVATLCRLLPLRPATRHCLWTAVLAFMIVAPLLPAPPAALPERVGSGALTLADQAHRTIVAARAPTMALLGASRDGEATTGPLATDRAATNPVALLPDHTPGASAPITDEVTAPAEPTPRFAPPARRTFVPALQRGPARSTGPGALPAGSEGPVAALARPIGLPEARPAADAIARPPRRSAADLRAVVPVVPAIDPLRADEPGVATSPESRRATTPTTAPVPPAIGATSIPTHSPWRVMLEHAVQTARSIPPLPAVAWLAGAALVVLVTLLRAAQAARFARSSLVAPPDVVAMVADVAQQVGLARPPAVGLSPVACSPMVALLPRPRLILPDALWRQLDVEGRRAVMLHELAHLARRDHWICWIDLLVAALWWWHPVAWWIRRRVRDEADLACDAWVVALMPTARRAYAVALIETKALTGTATDRLRPAVALGVRPLSKKPFARRLTMVMTHSVTPQRTAIAVAAAALLAGAGWLVTPALACPPEDGSATKVTLATAKSGKKAKATAPACEATCETACTSTCTATCETTCETAETPAPERSTFEEFMRDRGASFGFFGDDEKQTDERIAMLEEQIARMAEKLAAWAEERFGEIEHEDVDALRDQLHDHVAQLQRRAAEHTIRDAMKLAQDAYQRARVEYAQAADVPAVSSPMIATVSAEGPITRRYELPKGRLEALTALMSRPDVPIYITPGDRWIEVHGTEAQHQVFSAFATMLAQEDEERSYALAPGKLEALTELMIRPDVPVLVSPGDSEITVHGNSLEQLIFGAFVRMIAPDVAEAPPARGVTIGAVQREADPFGGAAPEPMRKLEALHAEHHALHQHRAELEAKARTMWREGEEIESRIDQLEEAADAMEAQAEEAQGARRVELLERMNEVLVEAQRLRGRARILEASAESLEADMDALDSRADAIEARIEQLEAELEQVRAARRDR